LKIKKGDWNAALAMAPSVSIEFWKTLTLTYAQQLNKNSNELCVPFLIGFYFMYVIYVLFMFSKSLSL
jgi:hypothetical protein